jgi:hypothetical protein
MQAEAMKKTIAVEIADVLIVSLNVASFPNRGDRCFEADSSDGGLRTHLPIRKLRPSERKWLTGRVIRRRGCSQLENAGRLQNDFKLLSVSTEEGASVSYS